MMTIRINPAGVADEYLAGLNACFQPWGDARAFDWYFRRATTYQAPDLIVITREERLIAGSGVTYRALALPGDSRIDIGIMTGSWTLPEARGQGCFTRIIGTSLALTAARNGTLLLAFVTEDNRSCDILARAGATLIPSSYCIADQCDPPQHDGAHIMVVETNDCTMREIWERMRSYHEHAVRFAYRSADEVVAQFIERPGRTEILRDDRGTLAIVERKGAMDLVHLLLPSGDEHEQCAGALAPLLRRAHAGGRRCFVYATRPPVVQACRELGCSVKRGYIAVLVADAARLRASARPALLGDEQVSAPPDRADPLLRGPWQVQGGDRS